MSAENWRPVPGYEGMYDASTRGRVRSNSRLDARGRRRRERILRPRRSPNGRLYFALYRDGVRRDFQAHYLVLVTFVGPRPEGLDGCHWDDDPTNNHLENLRWDTRSANVLDCVRNGTHSMANKIRCPSGHAYTPDNTYMHPRGARVCRECRRIYREEHREERRVKGREYMRRKRAEARNQQIRKAS